MKTVATTGDSSAVNVVQAEPENIRAVLTTLKAHAERIRGGIEEINFGSPPDWFVSPSPLNPLQLPTSLPQEGSVRAIRRSFYPFSHFE